MADEPKIAGPEARRMESMSDRLSVGPVKKPWWHPIKEPGSAVQILIAAALAMTIGLSVATTVSSIPAAVPVLLMIPGELWLRALKAVVLPLIVCSMILAVQRLREISKGASRLAKWTIGYYVLTTLLAIIVSCIMTATVWGPMYTVVSEEALATSGKSKIPKEEDTRIHSVIRLMFMSMIPDNLVKAVAENQLLGILVSAIVVGYMIRGPDSSILRGVKEVERIVTRVVEFLIKVAPVGIFFLILASLLKLNVASIGQNLGFLIGGTLANMAMHLFVVVPILFFSVTRMNPYLYWFKNSPAWITAWGSASSAATLSVTMKCGQARGIPGTICRFALPLGCLINMDGTAIYFPMTIVFLARTAGMDLQAADYMLICLLATLASIGTTPIPSASLVLMVMIAGSVGVPVTGMYGAIVAIDWFLDRFRTAINISGDLFGAMAVYKITKIEDPDDSPEDLQDRSREADYNV